MGGFSWNWKYVNYDADKSRLNSWKTGLCWDLGQRTCANDMWRGRGIRPTECPLFSKCNYERSEYDVTRLTKITHALHCFHILHTSRRADWCFVILKTALYYNPVINFNARHTHAKTHSSISLAKHAEPLHIQYQRCRHVNLYRRSQK